LDQINDLLFFLAQNYFSGFMQVLFKYLKTINYTVGLSPARFVTLMKKVFTLKLEFVIGEARLEKVRVGLVKFG
jgi:hypothetical protein